MSTLVAPFAASAGLLLGDQVPTATLIPLGAGAAILTVIAPAQDHVRSTLHLSGEHQRATMVSASQLVFTCVALGALDLSGAPQAWVPLSALAMGGAGSAAVGLKLTSFTTTEAFDLPPVRDLIRVGRTLLPAALIQEATILVASATLASLVSAAALGSAEAARIVARPVQAFSLGISRTLAPRLMEAGEIRSRSRAGRIASLYAAAIAGGGIVYLALAGWSYGHSPFVAVAPAAYEESGLAALFLIAALTGAIAQIPRGVLLGASQGKQILVITAVASASRIAIVAVMAVSMGAFALPAAQLISLALVGGLGLRASRRILDRP